MHGGMWKLKWSSHHEFALDLFKERSRPPPPPSPPPPKLEVRSSRGFWEVVASRVSTKCAVETASDESEGAMAPKAFKDWGHPKEGKVRFVGKGTKPICVGIWSCSSNKLWLIVWDVVDITFWLSFSLVSLLHPSRSNPISRWFFQGKRRRVNYRGFLSSFGYEVTPWMKNISYNVAQPTFPYRFGSFLQQGS